MSFLGTPEHSAAPIGDQGITGLAVALLRCCAVALVADSLHRPSLRLRVVVMNLISGGQGILRNFFRWGVGGGQAGGAGRPRSVERAVLECFEW